MRSSFGRNFLSASLILLLTLILLGSVFQQLTDNYLTDFTFRRLDENADTISRLATSFVTGDGERREFLINLDMASRLSGTDIVICNSEGRSLIQI